MSITVEQAKELKVGQILYVKNLFNADGSFKRYKVNGKVKVWKRSPEKVKIPVKHGLYEYGYVTHENLEYFSLNE